MMPLAAQQSEQERITARLLEAASARDLARCIDEMRDGLNLATVAALKQQVDAVKLRNAAHALEIAEVAQAVAAAIGDEVATGLALWARGNALYHLSRFHDALAAYQQAEAIYASHNLALEVTRLCINQVAVLQDTGAFAEALAVADAARAACVDLGEEALPFLALLEMNLGAACQQLAHFDDALAAYARGRAILDDLGDTVQTARIDINRANVVQELGDFDLAAELYATARSTLEREGMAQEVARADHNLGKLAYRRGHYHEALRSLEAAWSGYAAIPNPLEMAKADLYRALVYRDLNLLEETIDLALAAERRFARADTRWERAVALNIAGVGHARLGQISAAEQLLVRARRLFQRQGAVARVAQIDLDRAELLLEAEFRSQNSEFRSTSTTQRPSPQGGERMLQRTNTSARRLALRVLRTIDSAAWPALAARAQIVLARCTILSPKPRPDAALRRLALAETLVSVDASPEWAKIHHTRGQCFELLGNSAAAYAAYAAAVVVAEQVRRRLPLDVLQLAFLDEQLPLYHDLLRLSMSFAMPEVTFAALALALSAPLPQPVPQADDELTAQLTMLREAWHWQQSRAEEEPSAAAFGATLRMLEQQLADLTLRFQVRSSPLLAGAEDSTVLLDGVRARDDLARLQACLAPGSAMLICVRLDDRALLAVLRGESLTLRVQPVPELERTLRSWRFALQQGYQQPASAAELTRARAHLQRFYRALVAPVEDALNGLTQLYLVLDPAWHDLPLAAAFDGSQHLVERFDLAYLSAPQALLGEFRIQDSGFRIQDSEAQRSEIGAGEIRRAEACATTKTLHAAFTGGRMLRPSHSTEESRRIRRIVRRWGDRRHETGDTRQQARDRRHETAGTRQQTRNEETRRPKESLRPPRALRFKHVRTLRSLRLCGSKPARHGPVLLVGHSDGGRLRAAPQEAQQIATLLADEHEVRCLLETDATAAAISALLPDCGLLHFAGHAVFRPDNPRFSWLRLDGGRLAIIDLEQLTLRGNPLVVLSACETGRGLPRGGGLLGMGRALMAAGASALIVSLWQIVDASAAAVMVDLYTHLHGAPAAALCQAQRMAIVRGDHPAHWAGFICVAG